VDLGYTFWVSESDGGWVRNMVPAVVSRVGNYVLLGQAMRKNDVYDKLVTRCGGGKKNKKAKKRAKIYLSEEVKMSMYFDEHSARGHYVITQWD
jgi:hypothetical protein